MDKKGRVLSMDVIRGAAAAASVVAASDELKRSSVPPRQMGGASWLS